MEPTNICFVFGANLRGAHGKGAAYHARMAYGAIYGQGEGLQGQSYAIPSKGYKLEVLPLRVIRGHVEKFVKFASKNPDMIFKVTPIGTGLAGYKHEEIAPMFMEAPLNCILPWSWKPHIDIDGRLYWKS